jgi:uncharacterized protein YjbI with pentapeptide repeats
VSVLLVALGLFYTNAANREQQKLSREQQYLALQGQVADRFSAAIDQLGQEGNDKLSIRLGGIYGLQRLMRDSPADEASVVQVLSAFVRTHAPRGRALWKVPAESAPPIAPGDVRAAITVLAGRARPSFYPVDFSNTFLGLDHIDLSKASLALVELENANLSGASMVGVDVQQANLAGATLSRANLQGARLAGAALRDADVSIANLQNADLRDANLAGADLSGSDMRGVNLSKVLRGAQLADVQLTSANLDGANLEGADLRRADLVVDPNPDGVFRVSTLRGANLRTANLRGVSLVGVDLTGADLTGADLTGADLTAANLSGVTLIGALGLHGADGKADVSESPRVVPSASSTR